MKSMTECCRAVLEHCPNPYAKTYAQAWLNGQVANTCAQYGLPLSEGRVSQALYILSNMGGWRGEVAAQVRHALKRIAGGHND